MSEYVNPQSPKLKSLAPKAVTFSVHVKSSISMNVKDV